MVGMQRPMRCHAFRAQLIKHNESVMHMTPLGRPDTPWGGYDRLAARGSALWRPILHPCLLDKPVAHGALAPRGLRRWDRAGDRNTDWTERPAPQS